MGKKQQKPTTPQLLFHEALGQDLTQKFIQITNYTTRRSSVATYFATGVAEQEIEVTESPFTVNATAIPPAVPESPDAKGDVEPPSTSSNQPFPETKNVLAEPAVDLNKDSTGRTYSLGDLNAFQAIERLVSRHGRMTHMGVRDHNYDFFLNHTKTGLLSYRLIDGRVAVISGDPMCPVSGYTELLEEFQSHCKANHWQWAMQGGSREMANIARDNDWTTVHYGRERVLNLQTNPVLLGSEGKRIRTQCKSLQKALTVDVYCPGYVRNHRLEQNIVNMYDDWRGSRNTSRSVQAYITVFDLLAFHRLMIFVYAHDKGKLAGFAALRRLKEGYHIDPITVASDAPKGLTDLLLVSSMALLRQSKVTRLVLGVEPLNELGEIRGMSKPLERLTRKSHRLVSAEIHQGGKKGFNDRFRPDEAFEEQLFMIYPNSPGIKQSVAMAHFANIRLHEAIKQRVAKERVRRRRNSDPEVRQGIAADDNIVRDAGVSPRHDIDIKLPPDANSPTPLPSTEIAHEDETRTRMPTDSLLSVPEHRERASSLTRLFRRIHSDNAVPMSQAESHESDGQPRSGGFLTPESRDRSASRSRLFSRKSSDRENKPSVAPTAASTCLPHVDAPEEIARESRVLSRV